MLEDEYLVSEFIFATCQVRSYVLADNASGAFHVAVTVVPEVGAVRVRFWGGLQSPVPCPTSCTCAVALPLLKLMVPWAGVEG